MREVKQRGGRLLGRFRRRLYADVLIVDIYFCICRGRRGSVCASYQMRNRCSRRRRTAGPGQFLYSGGDGARQHWYPGAVSDSDRAVRYGFAAAARRDGAAGHESFSINDILDKDFDGLAEWAGLSTEELSVIVEGLQTEYPDLAAQLEEPYTSFKGACRRRAGGFRPRIYAGGQPGRLASGSREHDGGSDGNPPRSPLFPPRLSGCVTPRWRWSGPRIPLSA